LNQLVDGVIRKLQGSGLDARPLERVRETACTNSSEWLGELGLAVQEVQDQSIADISIGNDLATIMVEVRTVWPNIPRARKHDKIHPELKHMLWLNRWVGTPLMGLIAAGIFLSVIRAAMKGDEDWPLMALRASIGMLFVWAACYACCSATWYRRVSWLVQHTDAIPANVRFGWIEHALVATIHLATPGQFVGRIVPCSPPNWNVEGLKGEEILACVDPEPLGPIVLRTPNGLIWPLERGRVEALKPSEPD